MDGVHDMGGLANFGAVRAERNEPVFHAEWERRTFAMNMCALAFIGPVDRVRHSIERMDPVEYLTTSYYEHWIHALATLAEEMGYVTAEELARGQVSTPVQLPHPAPPAEAMLGLLRGGVPATRDTGPAAVFKAGDKVHARTFEFAGHTRLPRYLRGKTGTVVAFRGNHVFPDTHAHDAGEQPHALYTVRFEAAELWGGNVTRRDCVHVDLWESYLEPAA